MRLTSYPQDLVIEHRRSYGSRPELERLGIGVLGLREGKSILGALRLTELCRAVAACDVQAEVRDRIRGEYPNLAITGSYEEMLARPDVDIVAIYTPDALHAEHIAAAFRAGKHVLCTKPLVNDVSVAAGLLALAKEHGVRLQVGQSTRFYETFQRQREHFDAGGLGQIEMVQAHYNHRMAWYYQKSPWAASATHWAYLGLSHPVDLVRWYLGDIAEVHAFGTKTSLGESYEVAGADAISVNLRAANGRIGSVTGNYGFHELPKARSLIECFLMGSEGSSLARYPDLRFNRHDENGIEVEEDYHHAMAAFYYRHELKGMHYGEFANFLDYFASKLISGEPNSPDLAEGLQTVRVMDAIVRSLESGEVVRLS